MWSWGGCSGRHRVVFSRHLWLYFPKHRQRQSITHKSTRAPFLASHCQVILGWGGKSTRSSLARGDSRGSEELPWCRAILPCPGVQSPALPHSSWWAGLRQRSAKCLLWRPGITVSCQFGLVHGQLPFRRGNTADTRSPFHSEADNSPCPPVSRISLYGFTPAAATPHLTTASPGASFAMFQGSLDLSCLGKVGRERKSWKAWVQGVAFPDLSSSLQAKSAWGGGWPLWPLVDPTPYAPATFKSCEKGHNSASGKPCQNYSLCYRSFITGAALVEEGRMAPPGPVPGALWVTVRSSGFWGPSHRV